MYTPVVRYVYNSELQNAQVVFFLNSSLNDFGLDV